MAYEPKRRFAFKRRVGPDKARPLTVSIYPQHEEILAAREREFNVSRSVLVGLLLEIEKRQGLLRPELVRRLRFPNWTIEKEQIA